MPLSKKVIFLVYDCTYTHTYLSLTTSMPHNKIFNHQMCPVDCVNHVIDLSKYVLAIFFFVPYRHSWASLNQNLMALNVSC
jgi:hypothetical protein